MIYAIGRRIQQRRKSRLWRIPIISNVLGCPRWIQDLHAKVSWGTSGRQTARRGGSLLVRSLKSQNSTGTPNPRNPHSKSSPSPQSADRGRDQVRNLGWDAAALVSNHVRREGFLQKNSNLNPHDLSVTAPTKGPLPGDLIWCSAPPPPILPPLAPVRMVQPDVEAPWFGSTVAPALPRNVGL